MLLLLRIVTVYRFCDATYENNGFKPTFGTLAFQVGSSLYPENWQLKLHFLRRYSDKRLRS